MSDITAVGQSSERGSIMSSVEEIKSTSPMQRAWNKESMVAFINQSLPTRANLDVRYSYVYYDADKDFVWASANKLEGPGAETAIEKLNIKYWSKGIV